MAFKKTGAPEKVKPIVQKDDEDNDKEQDKKDEDAGKGG